MPSPVCSRGSFPMRDRILVLPRALASVAGLVLILAGPPAALVHFVGNPLPSEAPDFAGLGDALTRTGIDDRPVIKILALLARFVWLQIAAARSADRRVGKEVVGTQ